MNGQQHAGELTADRYFINVNVLIARLIALYFDRALLPYGANRAEIAVAYGRQKRAARRGICVGAFLVRHRDATIRVPRSLLPRYRETCPAVDSTRRARSDSGKLERTMPF